MHDYISYFPSLTSSKPEEISWETVASTIRGEFLRTKTEQYREARAESNHVLMKSIKTSCPGIVCQARLDGGRSQENILGYTGTFMADFDHVPPEKLADAVALIKADKHTMLAYVTISGCGLRVIARVEGEVTERNYKAAWLSVNNHYKDLLALDYDAQCCSTTRVCGLAWDPQVFFNPLARRMKINLSLGKPSARKGKGAGRPLLAKNIAAKVRQTVEADGAVYADGRHNDYISRCIYLMNRYGVNDDNCVDWAMEVFADYDKTHPYSIRQMVKNIYRKYSDEHASIASSKSRKATIAEVETYIKEHYDIRRNLLSYQIEYTPRSPHNPHCNTPHWGAGGPTGGPEGPIPSPIDDHFVNSLWRRMGNDGLSTDIQTINTILGSDFVADYHPFRSWIEALPAWDGETDHIRRFFSMVHCKDTSEETFHFYTRCWFLAMVASVIDAKVVNHEILTFIGAQGTYKSSFMLNILPPHLRDYYTTKNNSYQLDKDDYLMLAENILVSLEEIDSMTTKEINQLKAFTTMPHVKERPPYGRHKVLMPRVASLCATGNNLTFLTDQTGNRRWLPFHIDHIDNPWTADIPYEGMYAQALALLRGGEQYWLSDKQIKELNERNRDFQTPDPATEMIVTFFTHPRSEAETKYMTATKIAAKFMPYIKISPTKIGIAMAELGYEQVRNNKGRFWKVAERPGNEIDSRMPGEESEPMPF